MPGATSRLVDRRTLLVGAAGTLAVAGLQRPARAAGYATSMRMLLDHRSGIPE